MNAKPPRIRKTKPLTTAVQINVFGPTGECAGKEGAGCCGQTVGLLALATPAQVKIARELRTWIAGGKKPRWAP